jgi:hypothetical protein
MKQEAPALKGGLQELSLDLKDLASGIYFLRLQTPAGQGLRKVLIN